MRGDAPSATTLRFVLSTEQQSRHGGEALRMRVPPRGCGKNDTVPRPGDTLSELKLRCRSGIAARVIGGDCRTFRPRTVESAEAPVRCETGFSNTASHGHFP